MCLAAVLLTLALALPLFGFKASRLRHLCTVLLLLLPLLLMLLDCNLQHINQCYSLLI